MKVCPPACECEGGVDVGGAGDGGVALELDDERLARSRVAAVGGQVEGPGAGGAGGDGVEAGELGAADGIEEDGFGDVFGEGAAGAEGFVFGADIGFDVGERRAQGLEGGEGGLARGGERVGVEAGVAELGVERGGGERRRRAASRTALMKSRAIHLPSQMWNRETGLTRMSWRVLSSASWEMAAHPAQRVARVSRKVAMPRV